MISSFTFDVYFIFTFEYFQRVNNGIIKLYLTDSNYRFSSKKLKSAGAEKDDNDNWVAYGDECEWDVLMPYIEDIQKRFIKKFISDFKPKKIDVLEKEIRQCFKL